MTAVDNTAGVIAEWHLHHVVMRIELDDARVVIDTESHLRRVPGTGETLPEHAVTLHGSALELLAMELDGRVVDLMAVEHVEQGIRIHLGAGDEHVLRYRVAAATGGANDEGFTRRPDLLSTNCEPEGFRRITYFIDRPGNRATYDVTLIGDPVRYPTMLCNGDLVETGVLEDGRHWSRFVDPVSKPSYLFAVVAGVLQTVSAPYTTRSGRAIELRIAAPPDQIAGADFALRTMAQVMAFDEAHGGVEHDLDVLTFVAIPGYPDATEYHGLMFFDSPILVVDTRGFVDDDLLGIIANVAHEYGHHTRGNRVTVRSWGQLALKEGLTVLTAQNDVRAHLFGPVARVLDVLDLRRLQFPEELTIGAPVVRGEVKDPHQLYTRTTYLKGAEVFSMIRVVLGAALWQRVFDEFVRRHDLGAAGVDDFISVATELAPQHADAIAGIARWFTLAGRPSVEITVRPADDGTTTIDVHRTDSLVDDPPVSMPVLLGFHTAAGEPTLADVAGSPASTHIMVVSGRQQSLTVQSSQPIVVSALRGYSSPVDLTMTLPADHLVGLMVNDSDAFTRWWASEELMIRAIDAYRGGRDADAREVVSVLGDGLRAVISRDQDPALVAQLLALPDEFMLGDREPHIDLDGVSRGLGLLRSELGAALHDPLLGLLARFADDPSGTSPADIAARMLVEPTLSPLLATGSDDALRAGYQELSSPNATRAVRALTQLAHLDTVPLGEMLDSTYARWQHAPKLVDRWLRAQSGSRRADTIERVRQLAAGPLYDRTDRGRVMALWFPFATRNRSVFHDASGAGYRMFVDEVTVLMPINAGLVIRLVGDLMQFQRFDDHRRDLMRAELSRMGDAPGMPDFAVGIVRRLLST
ncbi:unannotated protein [freshwater metagenome]|uniref:Unannotated protein n=1 Tax=freshwater metagenome TaxID=449393 RepID=A0A6J7D5B6_9ZZZZ